jgi:uncharacterized protein YqeY
MMTEEQITEALNTLITELDAGGPGDFGKVMKAFMAANSNADGRTVSSILKAKLNE